MEGPGQDHGVDPRHGKGDRGACRWRCTDGYPGSLACLFFVGGADARRHESNVVFISIRALSCRDL